MAEQIKTGRLNREELVLLREFYPYVIIDEDGRLIFSTTPAASHGRAGYAANGVHSTPPAHDGADHARVHAPRSQPAAAFVGTERSRAPHGSQEQRRAKAALEFLQPLSDGQKHFADDLVKMYRLSGARGLASVAGTIRKGLQYTECAEADVYGRMRMKGGLRYWIGRGQLKAAIAELQEISGVVSP